MNAICFSCRESGSTEKPLVKTCKTRFDNHAAHQTCLREAWDNGLRKCPYKDSQDIPLENVFSTTEITQIKARSFVKWTWEEVIEPLMAISVNTQVYTNAGEQARQRFINWQQTPSIRRTTEEVVDDLQVIIKADHISMQREKGMKLIVGAAAVGIAVSFVMKQIGLM